MGYNRIVLDGTLADGAERWSTGVAFAGPGGEYIDDTASLQAWVSAIVVGLNTAVTGNLKQGLSVNGKITGVRGYGYPTVGAPAAIVASAPANVAGLQAAVHPLPTSWVLSLRTGLAGRRYRGRMYWPALAETVGTNGRFSAGEAATIAGEAAELLEMMANAEGTSLLLEPVVVSQVGGVVTPVTSVSVGDVPDTQRRRRDGLVEAYSTSPYPVP